MAGALQGAFRQPSTPVLAWTNLGIAFAGIVLLLAWSFLVMQTGGGRSLRRYLAEELTGLLGFAGLTLGALALTADGLVPRPFALGVLLAGCTLMFV